MKKIVLLLTTLLLMIGLGYTGGTGQAAAAAAPKYTDISTFVDGTLMISASKSVLVNGSAYVPVKLLNQIPGFTVATAASVVTVTGSKGSAKLNKDNSILYKNSNYVAFKTLLKLGAIDGKYATSSYSLFIWSTEEGKIKSNSMLYAISKLPGTMGQAVGKKVYLYAHPGSHWVTDVQYADDTNTSTFTMLSEAGITWTLDLDDSETDTLYTEENLFAFKENFNGDSAWAVNAKIPDSPFKNMEKVTVKDFRSSPGDGGLEVQIRRASGQEIYISLDTTVNPVDYLKELFYFKNPRTAYPSSDAVWAAIRDERIITDMTFEQVYLSWGEPDSYNEDLGYIVYGHQYLYFVNNKLKYYYEL